MRILMKAVASLLLVGQTHAEENYVLPSTSVVCRYEASARWVMDEMIVHPQGLRPPVADLFSTGVCTYTLPLLLVKALKEEKKSGRRRFRLSEISLKGEKYYLLEELRLPIEYPTDKITART